MSSIWTEVLTTLMAVIGTLSAPDHALFVSHNHPDGQVCENPGSANEDTQTLKLGALRSVRFASERSGLGKIQSIN